MRTSSPFSADGVYDNQHVIPQLLVEEWTKRTKRHPIRDAGEYSAAQRRRKHQGYLMLACSVVLVAMCAVAGFKMGKEVGEFPHLDPWYILLGIFAAGAIVAGIAAAKLLIELDERYSYFRRFGFGWHLGQLSNYVAQPLSEFKNVNLLELASAALDRRARDFVIEEKTLSLGLRGRLKRQDWKFDPAWCKARSAFSDCYDVMESFGLVEPVENPRDGWKPYLKRAELKLLDEESGGLV